MRSPRRRRSTWLAAACLVLLVAAAAAATTLGAPAATAQGLPNAWDCSADSPQAGYCLQVAQRCKSETAPPDSDIWADKNHESIYCTRLACASADYRRQGAPPPLDACSLLRQIVPVDCRAYVGVEDERAFYPSYCGYLEQHCFDGTADLADDHQDYCRDLVKKDIDDEFSPLTEGSDQGSERDSDGIAGAGSPTCASGQIGEGARERCRRSGSIFRGGQRSAYGLDNQIDLGGNLPKFGNLLYSGLQGFAAILWQILVWLIDSSLLLLEWAFSPETNLLDRGFNDLSRQLRDIHENVIGTPWMLVAISIAGLWGIWNGLVRQRAIQTLGALLATVLLMVAALVIIYNPRDTVWKFSQYAQTGALTALGSATGGTADEALATRTTSIFEMLVRDPWCALEFGDVGQCQRKYLEGAKAEFNGEVHDYAGRTVEDVWLSYPAGGAWRRALVKDYIRQRPAGDPRLMEKEGTIDRWGLLAVITPGVIFALLVLFWFGLRLLLASAMAVILTLLAPVMLLVPAFGEGGRSAFLKWAKRLAGAIIAKLVYAFFLVIVLLVAGMISSLDDLGWYAKWLVLTVFWAAVFFKRNDFVGFLEDGRKDGMFPGWAKLYYGLRLGGMVTRPLTAPVRWATGGAGWVTRRGWREVSLRRHAHREGMDEALRDRAQTELEGDARQDLDQRHGKDYKKSRKTLRQNAERKSRLDAKRRELASAQREFDNLPQNATRSRVTGAMANIGSLSREIDDLERDLAASEADVSAARRTTGRGRHPTFSPGEVDDWMSDRRRQVDAAGDGGSDEERRHRELFRRLDSENGRMSRGMRRHAANEGHRRELERDAGEKAARVRSEVRELRRRRDRMFR